jgi:hypothetical protein
VTIFIYFWNKTSIYVRVSGKIWRAPGVVVHLYNLCFCCVVIKDLCCLFFLSSCSLFGACSHFWSIGLISQFLDHFTDGRTPWMGDQLVATPLPKHRTTQTQKNTHTSNIHGLSGIRTHDPGFRTSEDSTCLRPLSYRGRLVFPLSLIVRSEATCVWSCSTDMVPHCGSAVLSFHSMFPSISHSFTLVMCLNYFIK